METVDLLALAYGMGMGGISRRRIPVVVFDIRDSAMSLSSRMVPAREFPAEGAPDDVVFTRSPAQRG